MAKGFVSFVFPQKGDTKWEIVRKLVSLVAFVVLVVCLVLLGMHFLKSYLDKSKNDRVASLYKQTPSSAASVVSSKYPAGMLPDFFALYDENPDVKGFINIPGISVINYPVVETTDNSFYLDHDFYKNSDSQGTLFLDFRTSITPQSHSQNFIIYGHNMANGQMFGKLNLYQQIDTLAASPLISFNTIYGNDQWKIFAVFMANTDPKQGYVFNYLVTDWNSQSEFMAYISEVRARSLFNIPSVDVQAGDKILTLSTCAYELPNGAEREVVMARRVRDGESASVGPASVNKSSVGPTAQVK